MTRRAVFSLLTSCVAFRMAIALWEIVGEGGSESDSLRYVLNTSRVGTRPLGPAVSLTALTAI